MRGEVAEYRRGQALNGLGLALQLDGAVIGHVEAGPIEANVGANLPCQ